MAAVPCHAADIELRLDTLERIIAEQVFTQDGLRPVRGTPATRSAGFIFSWRNARRIGAENGLLRVGLLVQQPHHAFKKGAVCCFGDSFDLTIVRAWGVGGGGIRLEDVKATTTKNWGYIRRVRGTLIQAFAKDVCKIDVKRSARKILGLGARRGALI